jgi:hypothetical protein
MIFILLIIENIFNTLLNMFVIVVKDFFKIWNLFCIKIIYKRTPYIQDIKTNDHILICKSCRKQIDLQKPLDLALRYHIMNNKPWNML